MINNPFHVVVSYNGPFLLTKLSAVKLFFFQGQQLNAKMTANSNLALILAHSLYCNFRHDPGHQ